MQKKIKKMSKKEKVITELFKICKKKKNYKFDNNLVKKLSVKHKFGNPFDVTKIDNKEKLPDILKKNDYAIIHLGDGEHKFIKGIKKVYHDFEPIKKKINWEYKKSLLNLYNTSESNILSVANNQRILHHFLFGKDTEFNDIDISNRPKTYFPHRTKTSFSYNFGKNTKLDLKNIQIEIDLTIEYKGTVGIFEAKNGKPDSFSIYQIYHPFLYYTKAKSDKNINNKLKKIVCVYLVRTIQDEVNYINLWAYTFENPLDISTIKILKSASYKLIKQN